MQRWVFPLGHTGCLDWRSQFFLWLRSLPTDGLALQTIQLLSWIGQLRRLSIRFGYRNVWARMRHTADLQRIFARLRTAMAGLVIKPLGGLRSTRWDKN